MLDEWPRSGGDRGNRSVIPVRGPALARVARTIALPVSSPPDDTKIAGGALASDGSLRVVLRERLFAIDTAAWSIRWSVDVAALQVPHPDVDPGDDDDEPDDEPDGEPAPPRVVASLPTVLDGDRTVLTINSTAVIVDAGGELVDRVAVPFADDSGPAPNVDLDGNPIFTTMVGDVHVWRATGLELVASRFGYDIVPVAVYDDGSFAVSGYAGRGFCRARPDGTIVWRSDLGDADLLPTVNRGQCAAVGSINDAGSALFGPDGVRLGSYAAAASFAACDDGSWIARTKDALAGLSPAFEVVWVRPLEGGGVRWGARQPIVDGAGAVYATAGDWIAAFAADGTPRATLAIGAPAGPLVPVREGCMATVAGGALIVIE